MHKHSDLIDKILNIEWAMFQNVKSETPASCQQMPDNFKRIRGSLFEVWEEDTLASYLSDLTKAEKEGKNLITLKYARMDDRVPPLKNAATLKKIAEIVEIEKKWQVEIKHNYPAIYSRVGRSTQETGGGESFSVYLACELETYGDHTLECYYQGIKNAENNHINLAAKSLEILLRKGGYQNIDHAERHLKDAART